MGIYKVVRIKLPHLPHLRLHSLKKHPRKRYSRAIHRRQGTKMPVKRVGAGYKRKMQKISIKKAIIVTFLCILLCKAVGRIFTAKELPSQTAVPLVEQTENIKTETPQGEKEVLIKDILPYY